MQKQIKVSEFVELIEKKIDSLPERFKTSNTYIQLKQIDNGCVFDCTVAYRDTALQKLYYSCPKGRNQDSRSASFNDMCIYDDQTGVVKLKKTEFEVYACLV